MSGNKMALDALKFAEAALADIGDADREPGDDLAWCEARAAEALPRTRAAIAALQAEEVERLAAQAAPSEEMSPEFTDTARAALLWVLWHHQGGSSKVGQPIRFALGMEQHQPLSEYQVREAQRWEAMAPTRDTANVPPGEWNSEPEGLTPKQAWWAGYRVGKGLPPDMSRSEAVAAQPSQAPVVQAVQTEVRFKYESMKPIDGYDAIYAEYATTFGRYPDDFMSKVVRQTKEDLFMWWGAHREKIRAGLVLLAAQEDASSGATTQAVRMLTREELDDVALSEQVGWGPGEYVEAVQLALLRVNAGRTIPADGVIGGAA